MIAVLDVDYRHRGARAACLLIERWTDALPVASFIADIERVQPYEPGRFYLRELPCLLAVLDQSKATPDILLVDGYVWLGRSVPGLGAHLHQKWHQTPVVGIAKTKFHGLEDADVFSKVYRGQSKRPLHVTALGIDHRIAAAKVAVMHGEHRLPAILQRTDALAKST